MRRRLWMGLFTFLGSWLGWMAGDYFGSQTAAYVGGFIGMLAGIYVGIKFIRGFDEWSR